jgi:hypothetical protein
MSLLNYIKTIAEPQVYQHGTIDPPKPLLKYLDKILIISCSQATQELIFLLAKIILSQAVLPTIFNVRILPAYRQLYFITV